MVFNTLTVGAAVTPSVIETYFSHYLNRAPLRQKPTAHISYHEGLKLIRQFLDYSSKHTIEDIQAFTGQWVPCPTWVRINDAEVAPKFLERAAELLHKHLGHRGLEMLGGKTWWQWRRPEQPLRAEWIEMKKEYHDRKRTGEKCERVILYIHGGAYYFGSVDEHRYQMQRHARKLRARVLAPRYRLAPQFPFPCGLYDCLATYFYLLEHFDPTQIIFAGDSAGGGMVLSLLCVLRDQGQPLPAGTILISPWVDLTHSFPSVAGDGLGDYIPPHGFHHRPSMAWPPPSDAGSQKPSGNYGAPTDAVELPATAGLDMKKRKKSRSDLEIDDEDEEASALSKPKNNQSVTALPIVPFGQPLSISLDGKSVNLKEQIQMYTTNELLAHPLVSPVMQPSLGGLPPMLIQTGGAELLRDEQIYLAHKAANPKAYAPNETIMREFDPDKKVLDKYPPTDVQLQLWEDLCHVTPTLSFTRPAKYMYRSIAQFGAWALAHAQKKSIEIQNDDAVSVISSASGEGEDDDSKSTSESASKDGDEEAKEEPLREDSKHNPVGAIGKAGDPIPDFKDHMIRQRVSRHGVVFPMAPASEISCLALDPATIGVPKTGPVRKWLANRASHDQRFANETKKVQKKRAKEVANGYDIIPGENPPPTALVNRVRKGVAPEEKKRGKSWGLAMWSGWGSSHDENTLQREQKTEKAAHELSRKASTLNGLEEAGGSSSNLDVPGRKKRRTSSASKLSSQMPWSREERPRSPYTQTVRDTGQAGEGSPAPSGVSRSLLSTTANNDDTSDILVSRPISMAANSPIPVDQDTNLTTIPTTAAVQPNSEKIPGSENTFLSPSSSRPHNGIQAYPFKLRDQNHQTNPSTATLDSQFRGQASGTMTPASGGAHSELAGDLPAPVELPSAADIESGSEGPSVVSTPGTRSVEQLATFAPAAPTDMADAEVIGEVGEIPIFSLPPDSVSTPGAEANDAMKDAAPAATPTEEKKTTTSLPFKIRNTIFDPRTSMLGSIGADGMPNAHHDFPIRSESGSAVSTPTANDSEDKNLAQNVPLATKDSASRDLASKENRDPREAGKASEAVKAAPFKMRHTVYEPNVTLAKKESPSTPEPENTPPPSYEGYDNMNGTQASIPAPLKISARSMPKEKEKDAAATAPEAVNVTPASLREYNDDRPPTPPPKDKSYVKAKKSSDQLKGVNGVGVVKKTSSPTIGALGFEKGGGDGKGVGERPKLESFVTASEGNLRKA